MLQRFLIALPLLFLFSTLAYGQGATARTTTASIVGSIVLPTNEATERHEILLLSKDGEQVIAYTYNDISGRYLFTMLAPGTFDIVVRIEGYEEERRPVYLSAGKTLTENIVMTAKAAPIVMTNAWDSTLVDIAELNRKFPRRAVDDFQKALDSKRKGDSARAIELLEGVVKLSPDFYEAHNLLGSVYQGADRYRDAEKQYNAARNLNAKSVAPLVSLATLYLQEAEANDKEGPFVTGVMYDDALNILKDASKLDTHNSSIFYLIGVTFYKSRSYKIAEASFTEALKIDSTLGAARLALANIYIRQQKWMDALEQFDTYLSQNPKAADRSQVEAIRTKVIQQL